MTSMQMITNVEDQRTTNTDGRQAAGYTVGRIVPVGTSDDAELMARVQLARYQDLEDVACIHIPATEDEAKWRQGMLDALAGEGYALSGEIVRDGALVIATVERV